MLFSHGIPGAALYILFSVSLAIRTLASKDPTSTWLHVVTAMVLVLMWFYELLTPPTFIVMLAGAAALRHTALMRASRSDRPARPTNDAGVDGDPPVVWDRERTLAEVITS